MNEELLWEIKKYRGKIKSFPVPAVHRGTKFFLINSFLKPNHQDKLLDVGCGVGQNLIALRDRISAGFGVDISPTAIKSAKHVAKKLGCKSLYFSVQDVNSLNFVNNSFDKIICFDVAEHLVTPKYLFKEIVRVLKPGGKALVYTNFYGKFCWDFLKEWIRRKGKLRKLWFRDKAVLHLQRFTDKQLNGYFAQLDCRYELIFKNHFFSPLFQDLVFLLKKGRTKIVESKKTKSKPVPIATGVQDLISVIEMKLFGRFPSGGVFILISKPKR